MKKWWLIFVIPAVGFTLLMNQMFSVVNSAQGQREYIIEYSTPGTQKDPHECYNRGQENLKFAIDSVSNQVTTNVFCAFRLTNGSVFEGFKMDPQSLKILCENTLKGSTFEVKGVGE